MLDSATRPAIVAGPLYVDIYTAETFPLDADHHTVLSPPSADPRTRTVPWSRWAGCRKIGGSSWQVSEYWAQTYGKAVFVHKVPRDLTVERDDRHRRLAFLDDGRWLKEALSQGKMDVAKAGGDLVMNTLLTGDDAGVDYAFHLRHPAGQDLWPIFSFSGGAASELEWEDVVQAWRAHRAEMRGTGAAPIIFLGGILRTNLTLTLARALRKSRDTAEMLAQSPLFIDFGRTDLRMLQQVPDEPLREAVWTCVRHAHTVLVDYTTANQLDLLHAPRLPMKYLVVRPHGALPGQWWFYRRAETAAGIGVERACFEAPSLPAKAQAGKSNSGGKATKKDAQPPRTRRPVRVALLVHDLLKNKKDLDKDYRLVWQPYADPMRFTAPEDFTSHAGLLGRLMELRDRVKTDPWFSRMLIYGPTGSGKEIIARWLHRIHPKRSVYNYTPVACGRLEGELVDSELFGHEKGAFTGADQRREGAFHTANGGVLLIDDLDALPMRTQAKLLRVIEDGVIRRVGSHTAEHVNVFLIVTTNLPPETLVRLGKLRADLYYRLRASEYLVIPPLRERQDDAIRIAKDYWAHRNGIWSQGHEWPTDLERWIRRAPLHGDCRKLEEIVEYVHRFARAHWKPGKRPERVPTKDLDRLDRPLAVRVASDGMHMVPDDKGNDDSPPQHRAPEKRLGEARPSAPSFYEAMVDRCAGLPVDDDQNLGQRFRRFLGLWADACAQKPGIDCALNRSQIHQCLGMDPSLTKGLLQRMLNSSANSTDIPRVALDSSARTGRGAKWVVVTA